MHDFLLLFQSSHDYFQKLYSHKFGNFHSYPNCILFRSLIESILVGTILTSKLLSDTFCEEVPSIEDSDWTAVGGLCSPPRLFP